MTRKILAGAAVTAATLFVFAQPSLAATEDSSPAYHVKSDTQYHVKSDTQYHVKADTQYHVK